MTEAYKLRTQDAVRLILNRKVERQAQPLEKRRRRRELFVESLPPFTFTLSGRLFSSFNRLLPERCDLSFEPSPELNHVVTVCEGMGQEPSYTPEVASCYRHGRGMAEEYYRSQLNAVPSSNTAFLPSIHHKRTIGKICKQVMRPPKSASL